MRKRIILGVQVTNRIKNALEVQEILTKFGCNIKTRLGLHEVTDAVCSTIGLLILEMYGDIKQIKEMESQLKAVHGIVVKKMVFEE
jgi:ribose 5-phosphate isomerase